MSEMIDFPDKKPNPHISNVWDVRAHDVVNQMDRLYIVDVRSHEEFVSPIGHIPGSHLVTLDTLPTEIVALPQDKTIVFVCHSGARSARATEFAFAQGLHSVFNLQGGMLAWNDQQLPVER